MFTAHSALFDHMAFDHNFSVGQPANIVFANKVTGKRRMTQILKDPETQSY